MGAPPSGPLPRFSTPAYIQSPLRHIRRRRVVAVISSRFTMANIAFIGLGIMGLPMAGHLLAAGHSMRVHSRTKSKAATLITRGARWAETPAEAALDAEFVFICVTDTPDVQQVILGENGIIKTARQN